MRMRWVGPLALLVLAGCARESGVAAEGESCVRAAECLPGLACVGGRCSSDLSGLEGGVVPFPTDAGRDVDGGMDAATSVDSGPPPMMDAGPPPPDAGRDAGPPPTPDSGPPPTPDAGLPPLPDSGPLPLDAA